MARTPSAIFGSALLLAIVAVAPVQADELPVRKAGYWTIAIRFRTPVWGVSYMDECVDAASEKQLSILGVPKECSKLDVHVRKNSNGYIVDTQCDLRGVHLTVHQEITGNFDSAYTMKTTRGKEPAIMIEAKWSGPCPADMKPGDINMRSRGTTF